MQGGCNGQMSMGHKMLVGGEVEVDLSLALFAGSFSFSSHLVMVSLTRISIGLGSFSSFQAERGTPLS